MVLPDYTYMLTLEDILTKIIGEWLAKLDVDPATTALLTPASNDEVRSLKSRKSSKSMFDKIFVQREMAASSFLAIIGCFTEPIPAFWKASLL